MNDPESSKEARRTELLNAASELLAVQPTASLADIAAHAGISKATLHRYFASRDDLILALGYQALAIIAAAISDCRPDADSAPVALTRIIHTLVPLADKLNFLINEPILDTHPEFLAADEATQAPILDLLKRGQAAADLRADLPAEWMLHHINFAVFATWYAVHEGSIAPKHAADLLVKTLLGGIGK